MPGGYRPFLSFFFVSLQQFWRWLLLPRRLVVQALISDLSLIRRFYSTTLTKPCSFALTNSFFEVIFFSDSDTALL